MIILPEDKQIMELLPPEDAKAVLLALFSEPDELPELTPLANLAYTAIKSKSDRITAGKKEFSQKQSEKGKLGGAPSGNQNAKKQPETSPNNPKQAKQPETSLPGTVSGTVSGTDTDSKKRPPTPRKRGAETDVEVQAVVDDYCGEDSGLLEAFASFAEMRKQIKKPLTLKAVSIAIRELDGHDRSTKIAMLDQSVMCQWAGVFEIKQGKYNARAPDFSEHGSVMPAVSQAAVASVYDQINALSQTGG